MVLCRTFLCPIAIRIACIHSKTAVIGKILYRAVSIILVLKGKQLFICLCPGNRRLHIGFLPKIRDMDSIKLCLFTCPGKRCCHILINGCGFTINLALFSLPDADIQLIRGRILRESHHCCQICCIFCRKAIVLQRICPGNGCHLIHRLFSDNFRPGNNQENTVKGCIAGCRAGNFYIAPYDVI